MTATTILVTPTVPLADATWYQVTLQTGLTGLPEDNESIGLQRPYTWRFRTIGNWYMYFPVIWKQATTP
jgi:hypothetical protein